jgi:predicted DNA-binding transcriptional regulator AlpA
MKPDTPEATVGNGARSVPALLSVEQVAAYTGIAVGTLHGWRCRGCGPPWCKLGGKIVRYRLADLEAWIESGRREN